jgi:hypothetical protein
VGRTLRTYYCGFVIRRAFVSARNCAGYSRTLALLWRSRSLSRQRDHVYTEGQQARAHRPLRAQQETVCSSRMKRRASSDLPVCRAHVSSLMPPVAACVWRIADLRRKSVIRHTQVQRWWEPLAGLNLLVGIRALLLRAILSHARWHKNLRSDRASYFSRSTSLYRAKHGSLRLTTAL